MSHRLHKKVDLTSVSSTCKTDCNSGDVKHGIAVNFLLRIILPQWIETIQQTLLKQIWRGEISMCDEKISQGNSTWSQFSLWGACDMFFVLTKGGYSTVHGVTPGRISFCSLEGFSSAVSWPERDDHCCSHWGVFNLCNTIQNPPVKAWGYIYIYLETTASCDIVWHFHHHRSDDKWLN